MESIKIRLLEYNESSSSENSFDNIEEAFKAIDQKQINWLNVDGINNTEVVQKIGKQFNISTLALKTILI